MKEKINYLKMLEESYIKEKELMSDYQAQDYTKFNYLADHVFNIVTYENIVQDKLARIMIDVCVAITNKATFSYIEDSHENYLVAVNFNFLSNKLDWGSSIRGAWWSTCNGDFIEIDSCGLWLENKQWFNREDKNKNTYQKFSLAEWDLFVLAMSDFVAK